MFLLSVDMEEPPSNSDGLQPQDLSSACSLQNIFDLTRNTEECLLKANPIDALHVVQTPGWFVNPGTSNGMLLPETDPEPLPLPTDQIQPDNAFSNTTVTLSYVSRSHVFSEHSPIYGVPSLSKALALHPAAYDAGKLVTDAGDAALSVDQHCLQQVSVPVGLTACDQFGFMSPAQVVENVAAFCYLQQPPDMQDVENLALETLKSLQADPSECRFPISVDELQNGAANGLWNVGPFEGGFPEDDGADADGLHRNANPELVFLISRSEDPVVLPNDGFAISLNQDFISPLDPESPSAEQIEDVFALPQTASSPSGANQEEEFDSTMPEAAETELPETPTGKTDKTCTTESVHVNDASAEQTDTDAFNASNDLPYSGSSLVLERKRLPPRARRGVRMGAIVQDIHPIRSRVCKRKVQTSKSKKKVLERMSNVTDVKKKKKEETDVRRSSRRKATLSYLNFWKDVRCICKTHKEKILWKDKKPSFGTSQASKTNTRLNKAWRNLPNGRERNTISAMCPFFSPQEPEIKLKCLNYKEEKKDVRDETFMPYVRMQIKDFPICTVVNYPEDSVWIKQGSGGRVAGLCPVWCQRRLDCSTVGSVWMCHRGMFWSAVSAAARPMRWTSETCMGHITLKVSNRPLKRFVIHRKRIIVTRTRLLEGNVLLQADGLSLFGPAIASCPIVLHLRDPGWMVTPIGSVLLWFLSTLTSTGSTRTAWYGPQASFWFGESCTGWKMRSGWRKHR